MNISSIPLGFQTGYGVRLTAFIVELAGVQDDSRTLILNLCASEAILPHYEARKKQYWTLERPGLHSHAGAWERLSS